jgi:hypothetical protein
MHARMHLTCSAQPAHAPRPHVRQGGCICAYRVLTLPLLLDAATQSRRLAACCNNYALHHARNASPQRALLTRKRAMIRPAAAGAGSRQPWPAAREQPHVAAGGASTAGFGCSACSNLSGSSHASSATCKSPQDTCTSMITDDAELGAITFLQGCLKEPDVMQALSAMVHSNMLPLRNSDGSGTAAPQCHSPIHPAAAAEASFSTRPALHLRCTCTAGSPLC